MITRIKTCTHDAIREGEILVAIPREDFKKKAFSAVVTPEMAKARIMGAGSVTNTDTDNEMGQSNRDICGDEKGY